MSVDLAAAVATRLAEQAAGSFAFIGTVADLDAALAGLPRAAPAAYVLLLAESAEDPDLASLHHQRLRLEFAVVIVCQNLRDATGAAASADLQARRLQVRAALMGWVPDAANGETVAYTAGRLLAFRDQLVWWTDEFRVMTDYAA